MPANILNLAPYQVLSFTETPDDYHIKAETIAPRFECECGSKDGQKWGAHEQVVKDLPMHGKRVAIYVKTRRFRCSACEKTGFETLPAVSDKRQMTARLLKWIGQQSLKRVFTSIAEEVGTDEKTVRNIFREYVATLEADFTFQIPQWLGIDEIHIIRKPRCVLSNIEQKAIFNILPDRNQKTVIAYLSSLGERERVKYVAMDMWAPYRNAVEAVYPNAAIVIDKFHVLRMANAALETVRKSIRGRVNPKERRGLMHDRFLLLRREHELTAQQHFLVDSWSGLHPDLGAAYRLKEGFYAIYDAEDKHDAIDRYGKWAASIPDNMRATFSPITTAWKNWHDPILAYFDHPITNAYTESLNSLIRVMNRVGRGYSFEALRAKMLFTQGLQVKTIIRPKFQRVHKHPPREEYHMQHWSTKLLPGQVLFGASISTLTKKIEAGRF